MLSSLGVQFSGRSVLQEFSSQGVHLVQEFSLNTFLESLQWQKNTSQIFTLSLRSGPPPGLPSSPVRSQLSIDSDSDMTESSGLLQEVKILPPQRPHPFIIFIIGKRIWEKTTNGIFTLRATKATKATKQPAWPSTLLLRRR